MQPSTDSGSHWCALYNGAYFDSYGSSPTQHVAKFTRVYNKEMFQSINQESCGYYAVHAIKNMLAGQSPSTDLIPHAYQHNERVLKKEFY